MGNDGLLGAFEELVLLAVVRGKGQAYGMTVRREIEERTGREVSIGAVYATLDRLEGKGFVSSGMADGDAPRGGRARRFFRILTLGLEALSEARRVRSALWDGLEVDGSGARTEGEA